MNSTMSNLKRAGGFIAGPILVGIALIVAVIGFMALANRGPATSTNPQQNKMNAGLLMKQGSDLAEGYARAIGDGMSPSTIDFTTGTNGLFNPSKGYAVQQTVPPKICINSTSPNCLWNYQKNIRIENVGTNTGDGDVIAFVPGIDSQTCDAINNTIYNVALGTTIPTSSLAVADIVSASSATTMDIATAGEGRNDGCVVDGGGIYIYYKVLNVN